MMKQKKILCHLFLGLLLLGGIPMTAAAQQLLSVPVDDPVYPILEMGDLRGIIDLKTAIRPYTEQDIRTYLQDMAASDALSDAEVEIVQGHRDRLFSDGNMWMTGSLEFATDDGEYMAQFGADYVMSFAMPFDSPGEFDLRNAVGMYMQGDMTEHLSYRMRVEARYDKLDPAAWAPYTYTNPGEGFYLDFSNPNVGYSDGTIEKPSTGFATQPEITLSVLDDHIQVRSAMIKRDWGQGESNFTISPGARSFDALEARFQITDRIVLTALTGTLTDYKALGDYKRDVIKADTPAADSSPFLNMLTTEKAELFLPWGLYFSMYEICLWPKRFEPGYYNPMMITTLYQNILGDWDNMMVGGDVSWTFADRGKIYGSFIVDEMFNDNPLKWFTVPRNIFALQGGLKAAVPRIPFTEFIFQYTRLEPFFSTHYEQYYPTYYDGATDNSDTQDWALISTSYMNKGENLGYYLPPNSDEFKVILKSQPLPRFSCALGWKLIRRGDDNIEEESGTGMEDHIDYPSFMAGEYPDKSVLTIPLHLQNILSLEAQYAFPFFPLTVEGGYAYTFGTARADKNSAWSTEPDNHTFHGGLSVYY